MKTMFCNGCRDLREEAWPHGAIAARCMSFLPPAGQIKHYGRTMQVFDSGRIGQVMTPAWCPRRKENNNGKD